MQFCQTDETGHTELTFKTDGIQIEWRKTSKGERKLIAALLEKARGQGLETYTVDDHGEPEKVTDVVPSWLFNRTGVLILKAKDGVSLPILKALAGGLIDQEIKDGNLVMEEQDSEWKILRIGKFELKVAAEPGAAEAKSSSKKKDDEKPQKVVSSKPIGGG